MSQWKNYKDKVLVYLLHVGINIIRTFEFLKIGNSYHGSDTLVDCISRISEFSSWFFVSPERSSERDYVITDSVRSM